tara:strand:+ start:5095 stop:5391 length:297 start_codon:yes stop_codon:yes gene_type:complete
MGYDSNNKDDIAKAQAEADDQDKDIEFILSQPRGRRFLYDMIYNGCHADRQSYVPGDSDGTAFNEGGRIVGQTLLDVIRMRNPTLYLKMMEENHFDNG